MTEKGMTFCSDMVRLGKNMKDIKMKSDEQINEVIELLKKAEKECDDSGLSKFAIPKIIKAIALLSKPKSNIKGKGKVVGGGDTYLERERPECETRNQETEINGDIPF